MVDGHRFRHSVQTATVLVVADHISVRLDHQIRWRPTFRHAHSARYDCWELYQYGARCLTHPQKEIDYGQHR